ncbi:MAG TPA: cytochrome c oxidase assembly protein [Dehalococcoidia bacterium]|nr:cytochrome c oxidase assembly protein [Dehalococcoidia bacterium]
MNIVEMAPGTVLAHSGPPPAPADLWGSWTLDPILLIALAALAGLYYRGLTRLWGRTGIDRAVRVWRAECFAGGLAVLVAALVSPLDALGSALFTAHMVQHLLLIAVAAPLLVLGAPLAPILLALPATWRRVAVRRLRSRRLCAAVRLLRGPAATWGIATATLWLWHAPALFEAALRSQPIHAIEHGFLLGSACLFWLSVLPERKRGSLLRPSSVLYLLAMAAQGTVLGIALAFSRSPWYAAYAGTAVAWHLSPLEDQQAAGLVMWVPAGAVYLAAALALIGRAIAGPMNERRRIGGAVGGGEDDVPREYSSQA